MKTSIKFKHQKIISPLLIAVIFGVMVIGVSCGKPEIPEIDYREKWVGVYECEEKYQWWRGAVETSGNLSNQAISNNKGALAQTLGKWGRWYEIRVVMESSMKKV